MSPTPDTRHLTPDEVELWAQGLLPATRDAHLAQCAECRTTAERERKLLRELAQLTRFAPEFGFVERVMAKVKIPTPSGPHLRPHTDA
jgi:predicted anti-sigma-YlaC factor YlaD